MARLVCRAQQQKRKQQQSQIHKPTLTMPETGGRHWPPPATSQAPLSSPVHVSHAVHFPSYQCHMLESVVVVFAMLRRSFQRFLETCKLATPAERCEPVAVFKRTTWPLDIQYIESKRWKRQNGKLRAVLLFSSGSQLSAAIPKTPPRARLCRTPLLFLSLHFPCSQKRRRHPYFLFLLHSPFPILKKRKRSSIQSKERRGEKRKGGWRQAHGGNERTKLLFLLWRTMQVSEIWNEQLFFLFCTGLKDEEKAKEKEKKDAWKVTTVISTGLKGGEGWCVFECVCEWVYEWVCACVCRCVHAALEGGKHVLLMMSIVLVVLLDILFFAKQRSMHAAQGHVGKRER